MIFRFNGSIEKLIQTIIQEANTQNKDIVVYPSQTGIIEISFQRHGNGWGRFFIAETVEENGITTLTGHTKNISSSAKKTIFAKISSELLSWIVVYLFLGLIGLIPFIVQYLIFNSVYIWIPLTFPIFVLIATLIIKKKDDMKLDRDFVSFLVTSVGCQEIPQNYFIVSD